MAGPVTLVGIFEGAKRYILLRYGIRIPWGKDRPCNSSGNFVKSEERYQFEIRQENPVGQRETESLLWEFLLLAKRDILLRKN